MCLKHNCRYFVLTTYEEWVFGNLSPDGLTTACRLLPAVDLSSLVLCILTDMHRAKVTTHLRAPIFPRHMSVSARDVAQPCFPVPNVFELLLLWILAAGNDDHTWWPQPPDMPAPVKPSEPSILNGGWIGVETGLQFVTPCVTGCRL